MFKGLSSGSFPTFITPEQGWPVRRHWLLVLVCALVFAVLMPREDLFPYRFQEGQPWSYKTLQAPFDFEVLYPDEQVQDQITRVNAEHAPYFHLDAEVARQQKKRFSRLVDDQVQISRHDTQFEDLVRNPAAYIAFGHQMLDIIYSQGVADPAEEAFKDTPGYIYLISGNMEKKVPVQEVGTINRARDFLTDTLPFSSLRQPELILPLLEKSLAVNVQYSDSLTLIYKRRKLSAVTGTGLVVHRGEQIVQPGEIVNTEMAQKLQSLQRRYHSGQSPYYPLGVGLLAFLVFAALLWGAGWEKVASVTAFPILAITSLLLSLGAGWLGRVGEAVPLLLPLWALPVLFRQNAEMPAPGHSIWAAVLFLTTVTSVWAGGWFAVQVSGLVTAHFFLNRQTEWRFRLPAITGVWVAQVTTLTALALTGNLPGTMGWTDAATFLLLGAVLSFTVYPLRRIIANAAA